MTKSGIDFFASEVGKCLQALSVLKPGTEDYFRVLGSLRDLDELKSVICGLTSELYSCTDRPDPVELTPLPDDVQTPFETPSIFDDVVSKEEPKKVEQESTEKYTLADVRTLLSEARANIKDFKVGTWLKTEFEVENATALPEDSYANAIAMLKEMLKEVKE